MEELNLRVFLLCTHSVAGALPLGILIISDERTESLVQGFQMLKEMLGESGFYGRLGLGPLVFMTDNCMELRDALRHVWPNSRLLLCIFHVMQQVWRWLHEKKNRIQAHHKQPLIEMIKGIVYANHQEISNKINDLFNDPLLGEYPNASSYLESVTDVVESWALAYRSDLTVRDNNTNNYVESQFLVIKDEILNRVKEYNVVGLLDKLVGDLETHYKNKLMSIADGSFDGVYGSRFKGILKHLPSVQVQEEIATKIVKLGNEMFKVPSFSNTTHSYLVDMSAGQCECSKGANGAPCKHQYIIWVKQLSNVAPNFLPIFSAADRQRFAFLAMGNSAPDALYEGIRDRIMPMAGKAVPPVKSVSSDQGSFPPLVLEDSVALPTKQYKTFKKSEVERALDNAFSTIKEKLFSGHADRNFLSSVMHFSRRVEGMPMQRLASALYTFGSLKSNTNASRKIVAGAKKAKHNKIHVQPEALKRRKAANGSRQKLSKGHSSITDVPNNSLLRGKRVHCFSSNVASNEPVAKKSGRSMASKTLQQFNKVNV